MTGRVVFGLITVFWVIMNVLLWRIEFSGKGTGGSPVSSDVVLERLLTSPDPSTLEVSHQGRTMGFLHWYPDPGEEPQTVFSGDYVPQGMVQSARGLEVRLEGSVSPPSLGTGVRLDLAVNLSADRAWKSLNFHAGSRQVQILFGDSFLGGSSVEIGHRFRLPRNSQIQIGLRALCILPGLVSKDHGRHSQNGSNEQYTNQDIGSAA